MTKEESYPNRTDQMSNKRTVLTIKYENKWIHGGFRHNRTSLKPT